MTNKLYRKMIFNDELTLLVISKKFFLADLLLTKRLCKKKYMYLVFRISRFYKIVLTIYQYTKTNL